MNYYVLTPIYQASTQILVNQTKSDQTIFNYNEVQTNIQLVNTYNLIIKSPAVLDFVAKDSKIDLAPEELEKKISVESQSQSQIINLSVNDEDPVKAAIIANTTAAVFKEKIVEIMKVDNVTVLSEAKLNGEPNQVKPRSLINTVLAIFIGFAFGVGISFLLEFLNNTVNNEQDVEKLTGLPVLGVITTFDSSRNISKYSQRSKSKPTAKSRGDKHGTSKR